MRGPDVERRQLLGVIEIDNWRRDRERARARRRAIIVLLLAVIGASATLLLRIALRGGVSP